MTAYAYPYSSDFPTIALEAGTIDGIQLYGQPTSGRNTIRIIGATSLDETLTTGVNEGTAGASTSSTSLVKPAGAANWTSSDLVGKWLYITGGGGWATNGAPVLRPITANTTTALTVDTVAGMDSTTEFQIVTLDSLLDRVSAAISIGIYAYDLSCVLEIYGVDFSNAHTLTSLITASNSPLIKISGCNLGYNTASPSVSVDSVDRVLLEHFQLTNSGDLSVTNCRRVDIADIYGDGGGVVAVADCAKVSATKILSINAPSTVFSSTRNTYCAAEVSADDGGATPVYLENNSYFEAIGSNLLTGSSNTGYGIEIASGGGQYSLVGCDVTGATNDVLFCGNAIAWNNELGSTYGAVATVSARAVAQVSPTKTIFYGNTLWYGSADHSSRELYYGIINPAQATGITAAGTVVGDATQLSAGQHYRIDTVASGTGVKLHVASALPGVLALIHNNGANALKIYPGGGGTIDGGASITLAAGSLVLLVCVNADSDLWKTVSAP